MASIARMSTPRSTVSSHREGVAGTADDLSVWSVSWIVA